MGWCVMFYGMCVPKAALNCSIDSLVIASRSPRDSGVERFGQSSWSCDSEAVQQV